MPGSQPCSRSAHSCLQVVLGFLISLAATPVSGTGFPKNCNLPYNGEGKKQDIDSDCPPQGKVEDALSPEQLKRHEDQNRAKNDLCRTGSVTSVTFQTFQELQAAVDALGIDYGSRENLPDRSQLQNLQTADGTFSEGDLVVLEGYVAFAKHGSAESCNCGETHVKETDIHVHLTENQNDELCTSVVVEMIPHYRPKEWWWKNFFDMTNVHVRVKGQLFFDGSHRPCSNGKAGKRDPARMSVWEIHPVYTFEVCGDDDCDRPSSWISVKKYVDDFLSGRQLKDEDRSLLRAEKGR